MWPTALVLANLEWCIEFAAPKCGRLELGLEIRPQLPAALTVHGLGTKYLVDFEVVSFEAVGRTRHVETPDAGTLFSDLPDGLVETLRQVGDPVAQRECVMLAKALEVTDLETVGLEHRDHRADLLELAVGKDVALDEGLRSWTVRVGPTQSASVSTTLRPWRVGVVIEGDGSADRVIEESSTRTKKVEELLGVRRQ